MLGLDSGGPRVYPSNIMVSVVSCGGRKYVGPPFLSAHLI